MPHDKQQQHVNILTETVNVSTIYDHHLERL